MLQSKESDQSEPTNSTTRLIDPLPLTKGDGLPDNIDYAAGEAGLGCEINPIPLGCLTCPLDKCKWDDVKDYQAEQMNNKRRTAFVRYNNGESEHTIAADFNVSVRTVYRWIKDAKQNSLR